MLIIGISIFISYFGPRDQTFRFQYHGHYMYMYYYSSSFFSWGGGGISEGWQGHWEEFGGPRALCLMGYIYIWDYFFILISGHFRILPYMGVGRLWYTCRAKTGGRLTEILPAKQTHFWRFVCQPFGENTFSGNAPQKTKRNIFWKALRYISQFMNGCCSCCYSIFYRVSRTVL